MECIDLLKKLITFDSSTKAGANETLLFCNEWLNQNGLQSICFENNGYKYLICTIGDGDKTLILNGHIDVVPAKANQFQPYIGGDKLYGRGSADMKAGVSAMMCALKALKNYDISCKIMLQLVTDEEIGGINCSQHIASEGFLGDLIICGEPTQLDIGVQAKGILQLDFDFYGTSAHSSRPWQGDNAIVKAYKAYDKIVNLPFAKEKSALYGGPSINFSKINGGEVYNKVPDYCKMCLDIRYLPQQNVDEILSQIKNEIDCDLFIHSTGEPVKTEMDNSYVSLLKNTTEKYTKNQCKLFGQHGSADTRFFSKFGIPAVEFGPCGGNWHGNSEFVVIDSVESYKEILIDFAKHF